MLKYNLVLFGIEAFILSLTSIFLGYVSAQDHVNLTNTSADVNLLNFTNTNLLNLTNTNLLNLTNTNLLNLTNTDLLNLNTSE
jgi:hypothetical protein